MSVSDYPPDEDPEFSRQFVQYVSDEHYKGEVLVTVYARQPLPFPDVFVAFRSFRTGSMWGIPHLLQSTD